MSTSSAAASAARLVLYHNPVSSHARGTLWIIRLLGLDVDLRNVDLAIGEQLQPTYRAINPQHCVPTLLDGDFTLWESRAISVYLARRSGSLLPNDERRRAVVDQRLYFDVATLYQRVRLAFRPISHGGETTIPVERKQAIWEAIELLEMFLNGEKYVAGGDELSVADIHLMSTMLSLVCVGVKLDRFQNIASWLMRNSSLPGYDECLVGAKMWAARILPTLNDSLE